MQFAKHLYVLQRLSTIPTPIKGSDGWTIKHGEMTGQQAVDAFDHLFEYIHTHWEKPASSGVVKERNWWLSCSARSMTSEQLVEVIDCRAMLAMRHKELEEKLESLPPYFREEIFPVAVARYMLRDLWMPINHRASKTFHEFHVRYGAMVLAA